MIRFASSNTEGVNERDCYNFISYIDIEFGFQGYNYVKYLKNNFDVYNSSIFFFKKIVCILI